MTQILRLSLPITFWLIGFSALYALQGLSCSRHWPAGLDPRTGLLVGAAVYILVQGLALLAILWNPSPSRFVQRAATILAAAALGAAVWTSMPVLAMSVCR
jgi:hypothetical protein